MWTIPLPFTSTGMFAGAMPTLGPVERGLLASGLLSARFVCARCGFSFAGQVEVGTASSVCLTVSLPSSASPSRLSLTLTHDGRLLISCGCAASASTAPEDSGP